MFKEIYNQDPLVVYTQTLNTLHKTLKRIQTHFKTSDELYITNLLIKEIYPILKNVKTNHTEHQKAIESYLHKIDKNRKTIYKKRKNYDHFINTLNSNLAKSLDLNQTEAQSYFPHYYERFKTDGIEYNIYIGESITHHQKFHEFHLQNLRLWQLQQHCELEFIAHKTNLNHPDIDLRVTSLILLHSTPIDIKFRMDEKKFDVDGSYNVRYEIIKKRIDKSHIKGTDERVTQPGKIAIVYTNPQDLDTYLKHIEYFTQKKYFINTPEFIDIEDLQGVSGLKAIRVQVNLEKYSSDEMLIKNSNF